MQAQQAASSVVEWLPAIVIGLLAVLAGVLLVRFLRAVGRALSALGQAVSVLVTLGKGVFWLLRMMARLLGLAGRFWRSTAGLVLLVAWLSLWGFRLGVLLLCGLAVVLVSTAIVWQIRAPESFDVYCGRFVRSWWLRWGYYQWRWSTWVRNLALSVRQPDEAQVAYEGSRTGAGAASLVTLDSPEIYRVRSGPAWDEVVVKLAVGQTVEDFDGQTEALAAARRSRRCVVRELDPGFVALDFERRDPLADTVPAPVLADVPGDAVDLSAVPVGSTEYGSPWLLPVLGSHTLTAGVTGAGKGSLMWSLLRGLAPAIRDGLVRVRGIDPKVLEMEFGRDLLHRYATTPAEAVSLVEEYSADMHARQQRVRGSTRKVEPTTDEPLELLLVDELGALTKYLGDKQSQQRITQLLGHALTQGRGLAFSVLGFVQDPTKETVPMRDLFPTRVCLRTQTESQTEMVLGDGAAERGALSDRVPEDGAEGTGYVLGEGRKRPLRVRAGWVPDDGVGALTEFCAPNGPLTGPLPDSSSEPSKRRLRAA
ncbi:S-DNA-T family DNA segregation ATPase FtsK/SpoIIIE [Actinopolyspora lacussalsi]|nr:S-DNA-T family DNA segregation ATPase FtsK/SpoIIIE [Actinopolyspora lacussalsi]